ncbi:hypothetical protein F2P45_16885 [Massilia sp. CCM 8733]|uniref:Uncharacterized protein n=1 Tax=Massilia mucilaginosa TaxID=2609282 RepID=A0ABX0NUX2_9BURK|nr:hypothetical protein [Massilia mucilaginosa]NHZ90683.1 hypothetical protein [Massilia mucilaginosa]
MKAMPMALAGALTVAGALWLAWPQEQERYRPARASAAPNPPAAGRPWLDDWPPANQAKPGAGTPLAAAHSLAQTHLHGDPDAPPIARDIPAPARPTAQELADPKAYQAFEARQNAQVLAAYVKAVDEELPRLREDIARGRAMGIAADQLARAEEKVRALENMRAQLVKDHPAPGR